MEISKELLSVVLGFEVSEVSIYNDLVVYSRKLNNNFSTDFSGLDISVYELAFKLKEWSYSNCCELVSYTEGCEIFQTQLGETIKYFYAETEVEAIFLACEYILNNIKH